MSEFDLPPPDLDPRLEQKLGYLLSRTYALGESSVVLRSEKWPELELKSLVSIEKHRAEVNFENDGTQNNGPLLK